MFLFSCHEKKENTNKQITLEDLSEWNEKQYSLSSRKIRHAIDSLRLLTSGMYADKYTRAYYAARSPFLWIDRFGINERADNLADRLETVIRDGRNIKETPSPVRENITPIEKKSFFGREHKKNFSTSEDIADSRSEAEMELLKALRAIK